MGSIAVSRISTALHASVFSMHPSLHNKFEHHHDTSTSAEKGPSFKVVMMTLFAITIPVEIIFLTILRTVGWLDLPTIFIACAVVFFCLTVRPAVHLLPFTSNANINIGRLPGPHFLSACTPPHQFPLEQGPRPRHVRHATPLLLHRPHRPAASRRLL